MITPIVQKRPWLVMMIFLVVLLGLCVCPSLAWAQNLNLIETVRPRWVDNVANSTSLVIITFGLTFLSLLPFIFPKRTRESAFSLCRFCVAMVILAISSRSLALDIMNDHTYYVSFFECLLCGYWLLYELIKHGKLIVKILLPLMVFVTTFFVCWLAFMNDGKLPYGVFIALGVSGIYLLYIGIKEVQSWKKSIKENKK